MALRAAAPRGAGFACGSPREAARPAVRRGAGGEGDDDDEELALASAEVVAAAATAAVDGVDIDNVVVGVGGLLLFLLCNRMLSAPRVCGRRESAAFVLMVSRDP